jgi:hypothetical protein
MWTGFEKAVSRWHNRIDCSRIGVMGHSYGGGAVPWVTRKAILEKKWGGNASFMFIMAPWYVYGLSQRNLEQFPAQTKLIVEVFEDDRINDHRMAKDLFRTIGISSEEKAFITLRSDMSGPMSLLADHDVPTGSVENVLSNNALDTFGIYRLFDSLAQYAINGSETARQIAFSDNGFDSNYMGKVESGRPVMPMLRENKPEMRCSQPFCLNFWYHSMNPRIRIWKRLMYPVRVAVSTPVTVLNYCLFVPKLEQQ